MCVLYVYIDIYECMHIYICLLVHIYIYGGGVYGFMPKSVADSVHNGKPRTTLFPLLVHSRTSLRLGLETLSLCSGLHRTRKMSLLEPLRQGQAPELRDPRRSSVLASTS